MHPAKTKATEPTPGSAGTSRALVPLLGANPDGMPGGIAEELARLRLDSKDGEEGGELGKERRRAKRGERKRGRAPEPDSTKEPELRTPESKPPRKSDFESVYLEVFEPRKRSRTPRREENPERTKQRPSRAAQLSRATTKPTTPTRQRQRRRRRERRSKRNERRSLPASAPLRSTVADLRGLVGPRGRLARARKVSPQASFFSWPPPRTAGMRTKPA